MGFAEMDEACPLRSSRVWMPREAGASPLDRIL